MVVVVFVVEILVIVEIFFVERTVGAESVQIVQWEEMVDAILRAESVKGTNAESWKAMRRWQDVQMVIPRDGIHTE